MSGFDLVAPPAPEPPRETERTMLNRLAIRYNAVSMGATRRYVVAEHVPTTPGTWFGDRIADAIVLDTHSASDQEVRESGDEYRWGKSQSIHGFEIKVSRSDWLTELSDPTKAEAWAKHCHYFWLVAAERSIVRDDLPDGWGLLVPQGIALRAVKKPKRRKPEPMSTTMIVALGRAIQKTASNRTNQSDGAS